MKYIVTVAALSLALGQPAWAQQAAVARPSLIGVWRVLHFCNVDSAGVETNPYGEAPNGVFVYTPTGQLSLHAMRTPPTPPFAAGDDAPTDAERRAMLEGYFGYFGTYTITSDSTVIHHVAGGTIPSYIGTEQPRHYRIRAGGPNAPDTLSIGGNALALRCRKLVRVVAQDTVSDRLRNLRQGVPDLPVERIELNTTPAMTFEGISAVSADKKGNLYVIHRPANGDPVVVLDPRGKILRSWGKGMFTIPHSIRVDSAGNVWTVDAHTSMVYKFTPTGRKLLEISVGGVPDSTQDFCGATDVAFGPNGRVFVSDGYCNGRVIEYDARGRKTREWGRKGSGPGEFDVIHALVVGPRGYLYAADRENGRVQRFTLNGKFAGQWKFGGQLYSLAFSPAGKLYISTHPKDAPLATEFDVIRIDPVNGRMLGLVHVRSHELAVAPDGTLLPATRSSQLLLFRPRK